MHIMKMIGHDGREIFVNADEIVLLEGFDGYTRLTLTGGTQVSVKDSPNHIIGGLPSGGLRSK